MGTIKTELDPVARSNPFGEQQPSRAIRRLSSFPEGLLITGDMVVVSLTAIFMLRLRFPVPLHYLALKEVRAMFHLSAHFAMVVLFAVFVVMFGSARKLYRNAPTMSAVAEAVAVVERGSANRELQRQQGPVTTRMFWGSNN
jgi:hypothetical protein